MRTTLRAAELAPSDRAAWTVLAIHAAFVVFGSLAMVTILAGDFPSLLQGPYTAEVFRLSWKYTGPTYVVVGCLAALVHSWPDRKSVV